MLNLIFRIFIITNSVVFTSIAVYSKEICPKVCLCDVFEGQKRADCSEQHLVSADINLAKSVEILNLSGNDISMIENANFQGFNGLINLSLAKNSIHIIELFAFMFIIKLKHLDLSDNRIESMDSRIIENNEELTYLDLSKNKFMSLDDQPLLISDSLEFLSLRSSHLTFIYDSFFIEMPKIIDLDLSDNLLITLKSSNFVALQRLQFLNIEYNSFTCDSSLEQALQDLKLRKVFVKTDKCNKHSKNSMFEKMIMLSSSAEKESKEDVEIDLIWGRLPDVRNNSHSSEAERRMRLDEYYADLMGNREEEQDCLDDEFMSSLCECRQNFISLYDVQEIKLKAIELRLYAVLYVGIFTGAVLGCFLFFLLHAMKKKCGSAITKQMKRQEMRDRIVRNHFDDRNQRRIPTFHHVRDLQPEREIVEEPSPTAQLLHRLFRDRDASVEVNVVPSRIRQQAEAVAENLIQHPVSQQLEVSRSHLDFDEISEYASAVSSTVNIDRTCTPPPAYREIYE